MDESSTFGLQLLNPKENLANFLVLTCLILISIVYFKTRRPSSYPPVCKGWIPWLGCAVEFGKQPLDFIEQKRKEVK